jgi:hypothetical protein
MFFGPSGSVIICTDPDPVPSRITKSKKNFDFYHFVISFWIFLLEDWCTVYRMHLRKGVSKKLLKKTYFFVVGILSATDEKVGSGSVSQWHGSADPGPFQNVTDP